MSDLFLRGGKVFSGREMVRADVLVVDGAVAAVGQGIDAIEAEVLDCTDAWVGPGLVDLHAHLREPGGEWKEDIDSGSQAAAAGGYTALVAMANTDPPIDSGHLARFIIDRGRTVGLAAVVPAGSISAGRKGELLAHLDDLLAAGVRLFSDDGEAVMDSVLLRRAMEYLADSGAVIAQHAEDASMAGAGYMHEGEVSSRLGMAGIPAQAEEIIVGRDLALVRLTGARYHVQHLSTGAAVGLIAAAKAEGLPVTAEVTPHHLWFTDAALEHSDPLLRVRPPLRSDSDRAALRQALRSGVVDAVATDHAPHAAHDKEVPFEEAPPGMIGLETAAPVAIEAAGLDPVTFFQRMAVAPAAIAGLDRHGSPPATGGPANLVVFDPGERWAPVEFVSRSANSPFLGVDLTGRARFTIFEGRITYRDGKVQH